MDKALMDLSNTSKGYTAGEMEILTQLARLEEQVKQIKESAVMYVRREEFAPIQKLVYGMVGVILLAFIGALVALVVR